MKFLSQPRRASLVLLVATLAVITVAGTFIQDRTVFFIVLGIIVIVYFRLKIYLLKKQLDKKE